MIARLRKLFKKSNQQGLLGIEVGPFGLAIAWVDRQSGTAFGECVCHYIEGNDFKKNISVLTKYLTRMAYENMPTHVVLHPALYEIYFVDRPEVDDDELNEAVRWKIKDLIDLPLTDLVVDAFPLPEDAYGGNQKKVYAITVEKKLLENWVTGLEECGLDIQDVGISELAVENIVTLAHGDEGGAAMLRMRNSNGILNLSDSGNLYLTRQLESGIAAIDVGGADVRQDGLDNLLLEVQRSLDFYDNQLGKGRIRKFFMAPTRTSHKKIDIYLEDNLGVSVSSLDINEMFDVAEVMSGELQANCFAAIGAACSQARR